MEYVEDEIIEALDQDQDFEAEESDDFKTMKESDIDDNEQMMFDEGQIIKEAEI